MKKIKLFNGNFAIVDDEDYERFSNFKFYENNRGYAYRNGYENKKTYALYLHREIISAPKGTIVDHINGDKLDNRKDNLRIVTATQNQANSRKTTNDTSSKYKGVCWLKDKQAWLSGIKVDYKHVRLGLFETEEAAAIAYNEKAKEVHGEFAFLNDVPFDSEWESKKITDRRGKNSKSKYVGVSLRAKYNDWQAHIMVNRVNKYLGTFKEEIEAAKAYNEAAIKYRGDKAKLNKFD